MKGFDFSKIKETVEEKPKPEKGPYLENTQHTSFNFLSTMKGQVPVLYEPCNLKNNKCDKQDVILTSMIKVDDNYATYAVKHTFPSMTISDIKKLDLTERQLKFLRNYRDSLTSFSVTCLGPLLSIAETTKSQEPPVSFSLMLEFLTNTFLNKQYSDQFSLYDLMLVFHVFFNLSCFKGNRFEIQSNQDFGEYLYDEMTGYSGENDYYKIFAKNTEIAVKDEQNSDKMLLEFLRIVVMLQESALQYRGYLGDIIYGKSDDDVQQDNNSEILLINKIIERIYKERKLVA